MLIRDKPARDNLGIRQPHLILHVRYEYADLYDHEPKQTCYGVSNKMFHNVRLILADIPSSM